jgi:hypothetical protein
MNVRESVCESVCVCERGNVRDCVREGGQRERERVFVCVCERDRECERERDS